MVDEKEWNVIKHHIFQVQQEKP